MLSAGYRPSPAAGLAPAPPPLAYPSCLGDRRSRGESPAPLLPSSSSVLSEALGKPAFRPPRSAPVLQERQVGRWAADAFWPKGSAAPSPEPAHSPACSSRTAAAACGGEPSPSPASAAPATRQRSAAAMEAAVQRFVTDANRIAATFYEKLDAARRESESAILDAARRESEFAIAAPKWSASVDSSIAAQAHWPHTFFASSMDCTAQMGAAAAAVWSSSPWPNEPIAPSSIRAASNGANSASWLVPTDSKQPATKEEEQNDWGSRLQRCESTGRASTAPATKPGLLASSSAALAVSGAAAKTPVADMEVLESQGFDLAPRRLENALGATPPPTTQQTSAWPSNGHAAAFASTSSTAAVPELERSPITTWAPAQGFPSAFADWPASDGFGTSWPAAAAAAPFFVEASEKEEAVAQTAAAVTSPLRLKEQSSAAAAAETEKTSAVVPLSPRGISPAASVSKSAGRTGTSVMGAASPGNKVDAAIAVDETVDEVTRHLLRAREKIEAVESEFAHIMSELAAYGRSGAKPSPATTDRIAVAAATAKGQQGLAASAAAGVWPWPAAAATHLGGASSSCGRDRRPGS
eukprot:TRINITY_DN41908_c0_g1_i1.p1 TRINITY_DN41908_c0_g1~~TRINITY_DN41908_c0_g1_i1.p1  ORF type:complete len:582 (-),score=139.85 TRINITY_DN41908_c0_g1_i1:27-1772(-)